MEHLRCARRRCEGERVERLPEARDGGVPVQGALQEVRAAACEADDDEGGGRRSHGDPRRTCCSRPYASAWSEKSSSYRPAARIRSSWLPLSTTLPSFST